MDQPQTSTRGGSERIAVRWLAVVSGHLRSGRDGNAESICRRVLRDQPGNAAAAHILGLLASRRGRAAESAHFFSRAAVAAPDVPEYLNDLGTALGELGRYQEAVANFGRAICLRPDYPAGHRNLGAALGKLGRLEDAAAAYGRSLALRPDHGDTWQDLLAVCHELGDVAAMIECRRRTVELRPADPALHSDLLYMLHYAPHDPRHVFAEHLEWAHRHAEPLRTCWRPHANLPDPARRLRVGYLSGGFQEHPVARFQQAILAHRDPDRFESWCYANVARPDATTARLRAIADAWVDVRGWPDGAVAERIRADAIDILVDLDGHSTVGRPLVSARRPAPVQVAYNGYVNTTGMEAMDWRITDEWHDPFDMVPGQGPPGAAERYHTERLCRLPGGCWCYTPDEDAPPVGRLPALQGGGGVTFGCLNKLLKVSPRAARVWAHVLDGVPGSRLVLVTPGPAATHADVRRRLEALGLPVSRVTLLERAAGRGEYLQRFGEIDISLDPFPFNGITTTCDSLWMGVPVVSLAGDSFVARAGVSLFTAAGMPELVGRDEAEYVRLAASLAADPGRLATLRAGLRPRLATSALCDGPAFARRLEAAYREMWEAWCVTGTSAPFTRSSAAD